MLEDELHKRWVGSSIIWCSPKFDERGIEKKYFLEIRNNKELMKTSSIAWKKLLKEIKKLLKEIIFIKSTS